MGILAVTPVLLAAFVSACWTPPRALIVTPGTADVGTWIAGLSSCRPDDGDVVRIDPGRPLTLFIHGCNASTGSFRSLAQVFEAHGHQTLCFSYNDRERLDVASARLITALEALEAHIPKGGITILGHSQGGLIGRHALVRDRARPLRASPDFQIRLVTVSSPFGGIDSSKHCGLTWLHVMTLGATAVICQGIAGSKWHDIFPRSPFMRHPGTLAGRVTRHVKIATDERDSCRSVAPDGRCSEEDFVFSLDEQYNRAVDLDRRVNSVEVKAGHIAIVGERGHSPTKLIEVLQAYEIMAKTPPERRIEIARLLEQLYGPASKHSGPAETTISATNAQTAFSP